MQLFFCIVSVGYRYTVGGGWRQREREKEEERERALTGVEGLEDAQAHRGVPEPMYLRHEMVIDI